MNKKSSPTFSVTGTSNQGLFEIKPEKFFYISISGDEKCKHKVVLIGEVKRGVVQNDNLIALSNGEKILTARVVRIEMNNKPLMEAILGESIGMQLSGIKIRELRNLNAS